MKKMIDFDQALPCEGCAMPAHVRLPPGWSLCGRSQYRPEQLAAWCPTCATDGTMVSQLRPEDR